MKCSYFKGGNNMDDPDGVCHYDAPVCKFRENESDYEDLCQENKNLKILLYAAIKSNGNELVIYDSDIQRTMGDEQISRFNDSANRRIVLKAKV
jgi:hypothetical protein